MPSRPRSAKQKRTMCAIAHGAKLDDVDVPVHVAKKLCDEWRGKHDYSHKKSKKK